MSNKEPVQKEQNPAFSSREVAPDNVPVTGIRGRMKKLVKNALGIAEDGKKCYPVRKSTSTNIVNSTTGKVCNSTTISANFGEPAKRVLDPWASNIVNSTTCSIYTWEGACSDFWRTTNIDYSTAGKICNSTTIKDN